jgi:chemotaxis protein methyltransferase CheR
MRMRRGRPRTTEGSTVPSETAVRTDPFEHLLFASDTAAPDTPGARRTPVRAAGPAEPDDDLDPELAELVAGICRRAGVRAGDYRRSVFRRRAGACLRAVRCRSFGEATALAARDPAQADRLLDAMMVGVTSFFRDPAVFRALGQRWARLGEEHGGEGRPWSVLSVGCSDGAELYSCAMLLDSLGLLGRTRLTGTDCRPGAIRAARAGEYPADAVGELHAPLAQACFEHAGGRVRVRQHLRAACVWAVRDAFDPHGADPHDVILCRNLAIYLSPEGSARLWAHLAERLCPGGLLVVGKAERPPAELFWRVGPCLYERKGALS